MKTKELQKLSEKDREKKLGELKMELMKSKVGASKAGTAKIKQIRKIIARIYTINNKKLLKKT